MNIIVAYDGSPDADKALDEAVRLAGAFGGSLRIVAVAPDLCLSSEEVPAEQCDLAAAALAKDAQASLALAASRLKGADVKAELDLKSGNPAEAIVLAAEEARADLVVIGSRGRRGATRFLLGSVSSRVAEYAPCNVLIVK